jgi:PTH1 family peptidyl-tRNA hydrolase
MRLFQARIPRPVGLIVGLGNPGQEYKNNRHNIGHMVVDQLAHTWGGEIKKKQARSFVLEHDFAGMHIILAKPRTFMNESGRAIQSLLASFKVPVEKMFVIYDELDLPLGTIRIRPSGGTGGHRGMRSIQQKIGSQEFPRMRVGIGRPPGKMDPAKFVLQNFSDGESTLLDTICDHAIACLQLYLREGINAAMNHCNQPIDNP